MTTKADMSAAGTMAERMRVAKVEALRRGSVPML